MALLPAPCLPPRGAPPLREKNAGDPPPSHTLPSSRRSSGGSLSHALERRGFPQLHDTRRTAAVNTAGTAAPDIVPMRVALAASNRLRWMTLQSRLRSMSNWSRCQQPTWTRRDFLRAGALGLVALEATSSRLLSQETITLPFENGERPLIKYPQKRPLIRLTTRPPQLETPFSVFNEGVITPNDAFFVRYHLAQVPTEINPDTFKVEIKGKVNTPLTLSLADLKKFDPVEVVAVNQCSGNSRGFSTPRVVGGQLGNGAMG